MTSFVVNDAIVDAPCALARAGDLIEHGAILVLPDDPTASWLVGDACWVDDTSVMLFVAYGESPKDVRRLDFDRMACVREGRVEFSRAGRGIGTLSAIDQAGINDPDDYHIAWQLWQQVAPLRQKLIRACFDSIEAEARVE